jgi:hypothetical protein
MTAMLPLRLLYQGAARDPQSICRLPMSAKDLSRNLTLLPSSERIRLEARFDWVYMLSHVCNPFKVIKIFKKRRNDSVENRFIKLRVLESLSLVPGPI